MIFLTWIYVKIWVLYFVKRKKADQIRDLKDAYPAADNIEIGFEPKVLLWIFGFLY